MEKKHKKRADKALISSYGLYSEAQSSSDPELIHIEDIRSRAELFDWTINIHTHPKMFQLVYVAKGSVNIHIDGHEEQQQAPCLITVPGSVVHGFQFCEETTEGVVVTVSQLVLLEDHFYREFPFTEELLGQPHILTYNEDDPDTAFLSYMFGQMKAEYLDVRAGKKVMFEWLLFSLLVKVGRKLQVHQAEKEVSASRYDQRYQQLTALIEKHYKEHLNATFYAEALHTTVMGLNRACNAVAGTGLSELLQDRLVLEAQRFLIYTAAPASLIAYDLGFKDPAYFSRFFKRRVGLSPGEFRQQRDQ
ncbi:MAG: helix-turn-helix domain-containing protein [Pontibacterium sp.]